LKCAVMIMLACLSGIASGDGYTTTQSVFLMGDTSVMTWTGESRFSDYADLYWASYVSNPDRSPLAPALFGQTVDVENTMGIWRMNFPFNISASSFGDGTMQSAAAVSPRYDFGIGTYWRYSKPMPIEGSTFGQGTATNMTAVQRNTESISQEITNKFGL